MSLEKSFYILDLNIFINSSGMEIFCLEDFRLSTVSHSPVFSPFSITPKSKTKNKEWELHFPWNCEIDKISI